METRAYRLRLLSPLHVGDQGIGSEVTYTYVPSDTLFSAVAVTWRTLPAVRATLDNLLDNTHPPLLLSSAFPYAGDVLLLPKPALPYEPQHPSGGRSKDYRHVRWVSLSLFSLLVAAPTNAQVDQAWQAGVRLQGGEVWVTAAEFAALQQRFGAKQSAAHLWNMQVIPRVTVDRTRGAGQIHHTGRTTYAPGCGLWCMAMGTRDWLSSLEKVLMVLGGQGLGGKRSIGIGQFSLDPMDTPDLPSRPGSCVVLLSRLAPTCAQMPLLRHPHASYDTVVVGGFSSTPGESPLVRQQVRMLAEGSIIGAPDNATVLGQWVKVTPLDAQWLGHEILRSGLGFTVPVQIAANQGR